MKTILITGAAGGLGQELVKNFLAGGWRVLAICRQATDFPSELLAGNVAVFSFDLTRQESLEKIAADLGDQPLDVLLNCAGVFDNQAGSVDDDSVFSDTDNIAKVFQVNSIAPKILADLLAPNLEKGESKLVATISSSMGTYSALDDYHAEHWPYSASKAALNYALVAFARKHPNIKSVLFSPGWLKTKMGGRAAPLEPAGAAREIFHLINERAAELPNGKLIDTKGQIKNF